MERAAAIIVGCVGVLILTIGAVFWVQSRRAEPTEVDLLAAAAEARAATPPPAAAPTAVPSTTGTAPPSTTNAPASTTAATTAPSTALSPATTTTAPAPATAPDPPAEGAPSPALAALIDRINHGGLRFAYRSATLEPAAVVVLDQLATLLLAEPSVRLVVAGHTDSDGELAENDQLSGQRAGAVVGHLIAAGVAADRLTAQPMGERVPIAPNDDEAGREANRRVDLFVSGPS